MAILRVIYGFSGCANKLNEFVTPFVQVAITNEDRHIAVGNGGNDQDAGKYQSESSEHALFDRSLLESLKQRREERSSARTLLSLRRGR